MRNLKLFRNNTVFTSAKVVLALALVLSFTYCEQYDLPEAGSIADDTPPSAFFSASAGSGPDDEYRTISFSNQSRSATTYSWDFGDGNTSTEFEPTNVYPEGDGEYTVILRVSDNLNVESTYSEAITVIEPEEPTAIIPEIQEPSFEDGSLDGDTGDGRDSWRNSELGGVIQITSSPVYTGSQAAKFPSSGDRIAYQELIVSANTDYVITYFYTIKTSPVGSISVSVLGGSVTDPNEVEAATIATTVGDDQTDADTYVQATVEFNSGNNETVAIYISNEGAEARVDDFSIEQAASDQ